MAIDHKTWAKMTTAERHASLLREDQAASAKHNREHYDATSAEVYELLVKQAAGPLSREDSQQLEWCQALLSRWKAGVKHDQ